MKRPALFGILNVTPDSFSGDGKLAEEAITQARKLAEAGADIIDIGAESTRPHAVLLTPDEEWLRLEPVLSAITEHRWRAEVRLSIDTRHAQTARRALDMGVDIINDVGGLNDEAMLEILAEHNCDVVVMHALSVPADPQQVLPETSDVVAEILKWKAAVTERALAQDIAAERLIYDPGIGFGKTSQQSLALICGASQLKSSGGRWLYGHSRKSFLKLFTDAEASGRDTLTLAFSAQLAHAGVDYLRVHAVEEHASLLDRLCT